MKNNHKARITYRFDQNEPRRQTRPAGTQQPMEEVVIPLYQEEFEVRETTPVVTDKVGSEGPVTSADRAERQEVESLFESHALNTFTTDFGSWNSSIETEGERVERIIRESQTAREHAVRDYPVREQAVRENTAREPIVRDDYGPGPDLDHSRADEHRDTWSAWTNQGPYVEPGTGARYAKSSGTPWVRIATSIAGAVITGVAFGFFVLSMFSSEPNKGATAGGKTATSVQTPTSGKSVAANAGAAGGDQTANAAPGSAAASASAKPGDQAAAAAGVTPVQIAAKTYAFLQNGVFSSPQSAQAAQDSLRKKGLASAQDGSDKPAVFVGFASSRDDALALSQQLQVQDKSLEVYVKNVDIPGATGIRWSGSKPDAVASFIAEGDKLVKAISGLTVIHLAETKPTALADSSLQTIRTSHQSLTTLSASVSEGAGDDVKPLVQKMTTALGSAVQSMEEYKKSPSTAMLWQAQSSMMQYILSQKDLLKKVSVS
ncbi:SPOR domain-containing protein [Paenibacillus aestuarii]|uniref:SPOR domain-containing protein n=1 Tax=Paenibacillus aestuarii TaxID=516965 RepID=A0ABW0K1J4_9BACL|nr:SPOR domain-containing protein [Paenibacillus aestuarii]